MPHFGTVAAASRLAETVDMRKAVALQRERIDFAALHFAVAAAHNLAVHSAVVQNLAASATDMDSSEVHRSRAAACSYCRRASDTGSQRAHTVAVAAAIEAGSSV